MAEYDDEPWGSRGWALNVARLRLDLYRLVVTVLASAELTRVPAHVIQSLNELSADFEMAEVEHGLISVAIMTRVLLDGQSPRANPARAICGLLTPDTTAPSETRPLTLREACNKIIHASKRNFDVDNYEAPSSLTPVIHLYGSQFSKEWKASLNVLAFASQINDLTAGT